MKSIIVLMVALIFGIEGRMSAQSGILFEANQMFTTNVFIDNSTGKVDNSYKTLPETSYSLNYLHEFQYSGLLIQGGLGMQSFGSTTLTLGSTYEYNFQYATGKIGVGYEFPMFKLKPYVIISPYYSYLVAATFSSTNTSVPLEDLKQDKTILSSDWGFIFNPGLRFEASSFISISVSANYTYGIENISNLSDRQTYNRGFGFGIGITALITKKPAKWIQF